MSADLDSDTLGSLAFVAFGNSLLRDVTAKASGKILAVLTDFLSRHLPESQPDPRMLPNRGTLTAFRVRTPVDYGIFSALKAKKTIEAIARLTESSIPEGIYALSRSLFENTLFLDAIVSDEDLFWKSIAPKADAETYTFGTHSDGRTNFNHVLHRTTGERLSVVVRISDLALSADRPAHIMELYSLFYVVACQYAHVDVLSAPLYFDDPDPFDQLDSTLVASLVALVLGADMIRALIDIPGVTEGFRRDAGQFLLRLRQDLAPAVELAASDPEHPSEIMGALSLAMNEWGMANPRAQSLGPERSAVGVGKQGHCQVPLQPPMRHPSQNSSWRTSV